MRQCDFSSLRRASLNDDLHHDVPPLNTADWPPSLAAMRTGFAGQLNVYKVMAHHPALLTAWASLRQHVVIDSTLSRRQSEIVILRVGRRWDSMYEWGQHVVRGRQAGLSDADIDRVRHDPRTWPAGDVDTLLMHAVDALLDDGRLSASHLAELKPVIGLPGIFDLMATVGMYTTLAFIVNSFDTPLEADIRAAAGTLL